MRQIKQVLVSLGERLASWNPGAVGAVIGLVLSLLWVTFGFFRMLFVVAATLGGYFVGMRWFSNRETVRNLLDKIFPPGLFR